MSHIAVLPIIVPMIAAVALLLAPAHARRAISLASAVALLAIAALLGGKMDAQWVRWSRPWTNVAWAFLTLGIGLIARTN
jgi:cytochrome c-type biogenesis protein CcmF